MLCLRGSRILRAVILPLTLVALLPACYKWSAVPTDRTTAELPNTVRVTVQGGDQILLRQPRIEADSIHGLIYDEGRMTYSGTEAIALSDIEAVHSRETNTGAAAGVVVLLGVVLLNIAEATTDRDL